jgi:hypothetical protein
VLSVVVALISIPVNIAEVLPFPCILTGICCCLSYW